MNISAVTVTYNSAGSLKACLDSLSLNAVQEIILVDNASIDNSAEVANSVGVKVIQNSENKGFAAAVNQGADLCSSEYILLLNPDAVLEEKAVEKVVEYFKRHADVAVIGLQLQDSHGQAELDNYGSDVTPWSLFTRHFLPRRSITKPTSVAWVSGGAMAIRAAAFKALKGFDPGYFLYWEDVDFCRRVRLQLHQKVIFLPTARASHERGASLSDQSYKTKLYDGSADRYFQKHYPAWICFVLRFVRRLYRLYSPQVR